jgi:hypothetical protein
MNRVTVAGSMFFALSQKHEVSAMTMQKQCCNGGTFHPISANNKNAAKHARTDRATYATFGELGWRGWKVASIRGSLWARSVRYGVLRHALDSL